jgi:hypothetical protein
LSISNPQTTSEYLIDERAKKLAVRVDDAYRRFVKTLPSSLQVTAWERGTFDHRSGDAPLESLLERNAINTGALFLFWELCEGIDEPDLLGLAEASTFIGLTYILLDHLVDDQATDAANSTLLQHSFNEQGFRKLQELFAADHRFWSEYYRLMAALRSSFALEVECRQDPTKYSEENFLKATYGKVVPAVLSVIAASMLRPDLDEDGRAKILSALERGLLDLISAGQLAHDVEEWESDLHNHEMTYFLSTCAPAERWLEEDWPSEEEIRAMIFETRSDVRHLEIAEAWFSGAKDTIEDLRTARGIELGFINWNAYIEYYVTQAARFVKKARRKRVRRALFGLTAAGG